MTNGHVHMRPLRLRQLEHLTPSSRGPEGTNEMLLLSDTHNDQVATMLRSMRVQFGEFRRIKDPQQLFLTDASRDEQEARLRELDESINIPRPEALTNPEQCDTLLWTMQYAIAQIGRMWNVAATIHGAFEYEVTLMEKWLRGSLHGEDSRSIDAQAVVMLGEEKRLINALEVHLDNCERVHKRIETQLPSMRDIANRRYQATYKLVGGQANE